MWDYINCQIRKHAASVMESGVERYTYGEVFQWIESASQKLIGKCNKREKCVVLCKDELRTAIAVLSCWRANLVPIPMSLNYGIQTVKSIIEVVSPTVFITDDDELVSVIENALPSFNINERMWKSSKEEIVEHDEQALFDVSLIMCTSGTTGTPKAAMITTRGLQHNIEGIASYFPIKEKDRILISRPLYHCAVMTGEFLLALCAGANIVFSNGGYSPHLVARDCIMKEVSILGGTPTLFYHLALVTKRKPLYKIRMATISGEPLLDEVASVIQKAFPSTLFYFVYGLTEASPRVTFLPPSLFLVTPRSVGIPLPDTSIEIREIQSPEKCVFQPYKQGLVFVKSPSIMKGYYNNLEATKKTLLGGWLNTGDIGFLSEEGFLFIKSRADDLIIKAGMNIYPIDVEADIMKSGIVDNVLVYGEKSVTTQEIVAEIVLRKEYLQMPEKEIYKTVFEHIPPFRCPSKILIVENIPRNASGKLYRREIKDEKKRQILR